MLTYEEYAKIRDSKGLRDSDVSRLAGVNPTTFSEWKKGKATPKYEKMTKIERALGIVYLYTEGDYGVIEDPAPAAFVLSDTEKQIIEAYRRMSPELKTALHGFMGIKGDADASEMVGRSTGTSD